MRTKSNRHPRRSSSWRHPRGWRQTLMLGLPVGLLQAALNQGDCWWRHEVDSAVIAKTLLSPLLSGSIAYVSALASQHSHHSKTSPDDPVQT